MTDEALAMKLDEMADDETMFADETEILRAAASRLRAFEAEKKAAWDDGYAAGYYDADCGQTGDDT